MLEYCEYFIKYKGTQFLTICSMKSIVQLVPNKCIRSKLNEDKQDMQNSKVHIWKLYILY